MHFFNKKTKDIVLIQNGNINFHALIKHYDYTKLLTYLKIHHIKLEEIAYCLLNDNHLIVIKNKNYQYPVSLIVDGNVMNENLSLIKKNEDWLKKELLKKDLYVEMINYAYYKNNHVYFICN